jgi:hypothetical protein
VLFRRRALGEQCGGEQRLGRAFEKALASPCRQWSHINFAHFQVEWWLDKYGDSVEKAKILYRKTLRRSLATTVSVEATSYQLNSVPVRTAESFLLFRRAAYLTIGLTVPFSRVTTLSLR